jgi:ATP-dependent protease ClpP protease subunit
MKKQLTTSNRNRTLKRGDLDPKVRKKLMNDFLLEDVHLYRVNRHDFTIYVGGDPFAMCDDAGNEPGVEYNMADRFEMNLALLSSINPQRPILINMASCGGNWTEGMQMFGAILMCPNPVTVLATKWARSMTSIIPLAADRFVIRPPAKYMIHRGTYGFDGLDQEADTDDIERRKSIEQMLRIYTTRLREQGKYARMSEKRIRDQLLRQMEKTIDVWLDGKEAVEAGFVDAVFDGDFKNLRAKKRNTERRQRMLDALTRSVKIDVVVS